MSELGIRWEPQREFGKYTVDFWIDEIKTVIEADGAYGHFAKKDLERTQFLITQGVVAVHRIKTENSKEIRDSLDEFFARLSNVGKVD